MSFRNRLTLFFVAIVILPMVSMAFVLFRLLSDNERGKADARLAARQQTARNLFAEDAERAGRLSVRLRGDQALARALRTRDDAVFSATLTGRRTRASAWRTAGGALRGSVLIRAHGLRLWARGLQVHPRPAHHQEGVER